MGAGGPIERAGHTGDGERQRNRPDLFSPQALDGFFLRHGDHAISDVAIPPGSLHWIVGPVGFVSVFPSCRISVSPDPRDAYPVKNCTQVCQFSAAQEYLQDEASKVRKLHSVKNRVFVR